LQKTMNQTHNSLDATARPFAAAILQFYGSDFAPKLAASLTGEQPEEIHFAFTAMLAGTGAACQCDPSTEMPRIERLLREAREAFEIVKRGGMEAAAWAALAAVQQSAKC
jgi:hypothetical protein